MTKGLPYQHICFVLVVFSPIMEKCFGQNIEKERIYVLGLYPFSGTWPTGHAIHMASQLAVDKINANQTLLADYELVLISRDSGCNRGVGINSLFKELYDNSTTKLMVLGPGCSHVAEPMAEALPYWNLLEISYSTESPVLSDKDRFPMFFRVCMNGIVVNDLRVAFMEMFGWRKVVFIHQQDDSFTLVLSDLRKKLEGTDMEITATQTIVANRVEILSDLRKKLEGTDMEITATQTIVANRVESELRHIKNFGTRIIFGMFYEPLGRKIICTAWKLGMLGAKYVWVMPGWYQERWWRMRIPGEDLDCTTEQMDQAVDGTFTVKPVDLFYDNMNTDSSTSTADEYIDELMKYSGIADVEATFGFSSGAYGYDTVWTAAMAIHEADMRLKTQGKRITSYNYNDSSIAEMLYQIMTEISFDGITGPIHFSPSGDRQGLVALTQFQNGTNVQVAICNLGFPKGKQLLLSKASTINWKGGHPPVDAVTEIDDHQVVPTAVLVTVAVCACLGIILAGLLIVFNILYRNVRVIKMSSPRLNTLVLLGGILVYASIIVGGIDLGLVDENLMTMACKMYVWVLVLGFSISFGSLFMKTWRIHRIITTKSVIPKKISDVNLLLKVAIITFVNAFILLLWEMVDPLILSFERETVSIDTTEDFVYVPVFTFCQSSWYIYWMAVLLLTNGICLIFGAFLSWETRHITVPALNDSKQIGTSIYIVTVSAILTLAVSVGIRAPTFKFLFTSLFILVSTSLVLCLLFLPKVKSRNDVQPIGTFTAAPEQSMHVPDTSRSTNVNTSSQDE